MIFFFRIFIRFLFSVKKYKEKYKTYVFENTMMKKKGSSMSYKRIWEVFGKLKHINQDFKIPSTPL